MTTRSEARRIQGLAAGAILILITLVAIELRWRPLRGEVAPVGPVAGPELARDLRSIDGAEAVDEGPNESVAPGRREAELAPPLEAINEESVITGLVINAPTSPVAGARVVADYRQSSGFNILDLEYAHQRIEVAEGTTDAEGRFRLEVPEAWPLRVHVSAEGYASEVRTGIYAGAHLLVPLTPGATFLGRVTRGKTGEPVVDVALEGRVRRQTALKTHTGPDGTFNVSGLPAGTMTLEVEPPHLASPAWATVELRAGEVTVRDFVLEEGVTIHGVVTDEVTGAPIEGARVGHGWWGGRSARTDARGRYELPGFGGPGIYDVTVRARGYGNANHEFDYDAMPSSDTELDFALPPGRTARGRVLDADGEPLAGVYTAAVARGLDITDWKSSRSDASGAFEIVGLHPAETHVLFLRKREYGTLLYDFPRAEPEAMEFELGEFRMPRSQRISGRVVDPEGAPLEGIEVVVKGWNEDRYRLRPSPRESLSIRNIQSRVTKTDDRGRFFFADLAPGTYHVRGGRDGPQENVLLEAGTDVDDLLLVLDRGLAIRGRVVSAEGEGLPGVSVQARSPAASRAVRGANSGDDGVFVVHGLEAGEYDLDFNPVFLNWGNERQYARARRSGLVAGSENLVVVLEDAVTISGRVVEANGQPASEARAYLFDGNEELATASCAGDGTFQFLVPPAGSYTVKARHLEQFGGGRYTGGEWSESLAGVTPGAEDLLLRLPPRD